MKLIYLLLALITLYWGIAYLAACIAMRRPLFTPLLWWPVLVLKAVLWFVGLFVVLIQKPRYTGLWRVEKGRPLTWWEAAMRNPVGGMAYWFKQPVSYQQYGEVVEPDRTDKTFQWRFRRAGWKSSIRIVWKRSPTKYAELYCGHKIASTSPGLDFAASLRPFAKVGN